MITRDEANKLYNLNSTPEKDDLFYDDVIKSLDKCIRASAERGCSALSFGENSFPDDIGVLTHRDVYNKVIPVLLQNGYTIKYSQILNPNSKREWNCTVIFGGKNETKM